ncbi:MULTISPECIES: ribonuclease J1 [Aerococcus]|uniref:Ribonuclease J n=2 Tax=Aerococcus urinae TaxID=1376 RepID=A0A0X8FE35_9LACT|nr:MULTISPECIES: ribonuclease J [Aerococcus]AMB95660.1 ribonuclease J [Aerococcus urinae]MCY3032879.1 ribonuclease J [Aerococcus urinae]MCY3037559.1 ribonuclease J [Aerococcus urinae]MCY3044926.1 ribonuclease J [Aerococcus urinae]MCY3048380.1 ribonuclease J [Aerococcus urinae]
MSFEVKDNEVYVFAIGGLGEIGKNMYVVQYQDEIIIMDNGVKFPDDELLGIDYVISDYSYLIENKDKVKGIFVSHGHEDHIGGIPWLLKQVNFPIYADQLALALIRGKLEEHGLLGDAILHEIDDESVINFDKTSVSFFTVNHSIPGAKGILVKTPVGAVAFTGDYKFDFTPIGKHADLHKMARIGDEGLLLLLADSTNSEVPGWTMSEHYVSNSLKDIMTPIEGRIIFASFASNISRLSEAIEIAVNTGRKIAVFGRSMENAFRNAQEIGYFNIPEGTFIESKEINDYPDNEIMIMCTGSQGEPLAALSRIANGTHRQVTLHPTDTVVFSSSPIPGNLSSVNNLINKLLESGAEVVHGKINNVHTSGHASQEQQKLLLRLMKPKFFMPVHGEYRMLCVHGETAQAVGVPEENVIIHDNGQVAALTQDSWREAGKVPADAVYVDGKGIGDIGNIVLRDRHNLSEDGIVIVVVTVNFENNELVAGPDIVSRGFIYMRESGDLIKDAQKVVQTTVIGHLNSGKEVNEKILRDSIQNALYPFLHKRTKRNPMILPVIMPV